MKCEFCLGDSEVIRFVRNYINFMSVPVTDLVDVCSPCVPLYQAAVIKYPKTKLPAPVLTEEGQYGDGN